MRGQCVINGKLGYKYPFFLHLADNLHEKRGGLWYFLPNSCKTQPKEEILGCLKLI
jgi:hypothetical protein